MARFLIIILSFFIISCGGGGGSGSVNNVPSGDGDGDASERWQPAPELTWQIQLKGILNTSYDVDVYDIDLFDTPASTIASLQAGGAHVICYFSAGSYEDWRTDEGDFPVEVIGNPLEGWPGENWLDVRNVNALMPIMEARMDLAVAKGCDAVDPDNVDGYTNNTGFPLTSADQLAYNIALADAAHERGLAVGLKNDLDQIDALVSHFDFAVNEQCFQYNECGSLTPFINNNKAVFGIEYELTADAFCAESITYKFSTLLMSYDLDGGRYSCTE